VIEDRNAGKMAGTSLCDLRSGVGVVDRLGLLQKAVTSYSERSHDGQHWAERYWSYQNDAQKIIRDAALDASQRNAQLQALR
jgi:hypothetical protein